MTENYFIPMSDLMVHAVRDRRDLITLCGTEAVTGVIRATWNRRSVVPPKSVSCRQCRWIGGGGVGPAPEITPLPDPLTFVKATTFEWPCDRRDAHGPHDAYSDTSPSEFCPVCGVERGQSHARGACDGACPGVKAHPATMIGRPGDRR